jgi:hypothetical protein
VSETFATIAGLVAIVLWGATIGVSRLGTEPLGPMTTPHLGRR